MTRITAAGNPALTREERIWLRQEIDRRKRERMRAVSGRLSRGEAVQAVPRRMSPEEVAAIFRSYLDGASIEEIASSIWQKFGYSSAAFCAAALRRYFGKMTVLTDAA